MCKAENTKIDMFIFVLSKYAKDGKIEKLLLLRTKAWRVTTAGDCFYSICGVAELHLSVPPIFKWVGFAN